MRRLLMFSLLAIGFALATIVLGWMAIPGLAAALALGLRRAEAARYAAIGASLAWALLLLRLTAFPATGRLFAVLRELFHVPGVAVSGLAVVFAGLLAWSAARVVLGVVPVRRPD